MRNKITGTLINYYFHCKRQCWLHANRINLEDNSEDVRIAKVMHELKAESSKKSEIKLDNVVIDKITKDYLVEIKKSDADPEAVKWQVLLYLQTLKTKGVEKKGKIEYIEAKKGAKKTEYIALTPELETELQAVTTGPTCTNVVFKLPCSMSLSFETAGPTCTNVVSRQCSGTV